MRFISNDYEKYPYAEERRLFYVALTRTKNNVYLLVPKKNKSIFILELLRDFRKKIEIIKNLQYKNVQILNFNNEGYYEKKEENINFFINTYYLYNNINLYFC